MQTYALYSLPRLVGTFTTAVGAPLDPGSVSVTIRRPDDSRVTLVYSVDAAVVKSGVGIYYVDVDATLPGQWRYGWRGTGSGQSAAEGVYMVSDTTL